MVQWEVHAKFGPDPSSSLGGEWRQTNKQTDRQTDTPFCFIYIDCRFFYKLFCLPCGRVDLFGCATRLLEKKTDLSRSTNNADFF